jgi:hypothetical protein
MPQNHNGHLTGENVRDLWLPNPLSLQRKKMNRLCDPYIFIYRAALLLLTFALSSCFKFQQQKSVWGGGWGVE